MTASACAGLRVLIVEDEGIVSDFILAVLEDSPHEAIGVAETGADALRLVEEGAPDVALVDIKLRGPMDGIEVAQYVRARWPAIRIVFATGSHDPANRTRADALAPDGFLRKPFMAQQLLAALAHDQSRDAEDVNQRTRRTQL
jgi:two-component system, response regulator PdtaR